VTHEQTQGSILAGVFATLAVLGVLGALYLPILLR
jgi:hypothetical protein